MSHRAHRAPKPPKNRRLRALAAGLGLAAATGLGATLIHDVTAAVPADSGWGAPDTTGVTVATDTGLDLHTGVNVTNGDSGWG